MNRRSLRFAIFSAMPKHRDVTAMDVFRALPSLSPGIGFGDIRANLARMVDGQTVTKDRVDQINIYRRIA